MKMEISHSNSVVVLKIIGELMTRDDQQAATDLVAARLSRGDRKFIFDFSEMPFISSLGIATLVASHVKINREGGETKLVNPRPKVLDILKMVKLDRIFSSYHTIKEATEAPWQNS